MRQRRDDDPLKDLKKPVADRKPDPTPLWYKLALALDLLSYNSRYVCPRIPR